MSVQIELPMADVKLIGRIARRAGELMHDRGLPVGKTTVLELEMDLSLCHSKLRLNLPRLLNIDEVQLLHDVLGIREHIDRETGELGGFLPVCHR